MKPGDDNWINHSDFLVDAISENLNVDREIVIKYYEKYYSYPDTKKQKDILTMKFLCRESKLKKLIYNKK